MPYRPWTPNDVPIAERANGGVWDYANAQLDSAGAKATAIPDLWGVRPLVQPVASLQVPFGRVGIHPALIWPDAVNSLKMATAAPFQPAWYAMVMQFRDGTQLNTDSAIITLWGNDADGGADRVRLRSQTGFVDSGILPSVNAGPPTNTILPLPLSLVEMSSAYNAGTWGPSQTPNMNRGLRGGAAYTVALGPAATADTIQRFQGYLGHRFGFAHRFPASHPFRTAPPMVYVEPVTAVIRSAMPGLRGAAAARTFTRATIDGDLGGLAGDASARTFTTARAEPMLPQLLGAIRARSYVPAVLRGLLPPLIGSGRLRSVFLPRGRVATTGQSHIRTREPGTKEKDVDTFLIKQGATSPVLRREFLTATGLVDLTGCRVEFSMRGYDGPVIVRQRCQVENGAAVYYWQDDDTLKAGRYQGQFWIIRPDGSNEGAPAPGSIDIVIERDLGR